MNRTTLRQWLIGDFSLKRLGRSLLFIYVALGIYAFFFSDRLIFRPTVASYTDSSDILKLSVVDGETISARYLPNPAATYTILYSHGNAEDLGQILSTLEAIQQSGFAVFSYDYRGYGTSQGSPSEQNTYADIEAAYNYLTQTLDIPPERIILLGRSVGAGPTIELATHRPIAGLIVESSFTSTFVVMTRIPLFPFDKFPNLRRIRHVHYPVLIIHGTADRSIPFDHGQSLFKAANPPKQFLWVEGADHNDVMEIGGEQYLKALQEFAEAIAGR